MAKNIFVSYSHEQGEWVHDRLWPVLAAGGANVLIDVDRFRAGVAVYQQMDASQDLAEIHLLVLSPGYLSSSACLHEMQRAVATDPAFTNGRVLPVMRVACPLPAAIQTPNPLFIDLVDDAKSNQWDLLTRTSGVELGASAADWLRARQQVRDALLEGRSVNLVVQGSPDRTGLFDRLKQDLEGLPMVDLASGAAAGRQSLITEILHALGNRGEAQKPPNDLRDLDLAIKAAPAPVKLVFRHCDILKTRHRNYKEDFFSALKHLVDQRKLVLLLESHAPYATLLPPTNSLSTLQMRTVELRGRTP